MWHMPNETDIEQPIPTKRNWLKIILLILVALVIVSAAIYFVTNQNPFGKKGGNNTILGDNSNSEFGLNWSNISMLRDGLYDCSKNVYNCVNFTTQAEAQAVYDYCKGLGAGDIHGLDSGKNGIVCEGMKVARNRTSA